MFLFGLFTMYSKKKKKNKKTKDLRTELARRLPESVIIAPLKKSQEEWIKPHET